MFLDRCRVGGLYLCDEEDIAERKSAQNLDLSTFKELRLRSSQ